MLLFSSFVLASNVLKNQSGFQIGTERIIHTILSFYLENYNSQYQSWLIALYFNQLHSSKQHLAHVSRN